jgi:hypothetical protein
MAAASGRTTAHLLKKGITSAMIKLKAPHPKTHDLSFQISFVAADGWVVGSTSLQPDCPVNGIVGLQMRRIPHRSDKDEFRRVVSGTPKCERTYNDRDKYDSREDDCRKQQGRNAYAV